MVFDVFYYNGKSIFHSENIFSCKFVFYLKLHHENDYLLYFPIQNDQVLSRFSKCSDDYIQNISKTPFSYPVKYFVDSTIHNEY
jgi:hypothetical protein